jgi:DNA-binding transcriptional LysR family regulator
MDRIDALRLFSAVAELESFTRAAERQGLTPGAASKQISALEDRVQARLLERTTRSVRLTDAGRALLDRVRPWLSEYEAIENGLAADQAAAAGALRVSAPVDFGGQCLIKPVAAFMERWPSVEVRLELADRMVDLVDEGYDVAVRIGALTDSSLIAKRLADAPLTLFASPDYLRAAGTPAHPSELSRHACIIDRNKPAPNLWRFHRGGDSVEAKVHGRLSLNGARASVAAACVGAGIACSPTCRRCAEVRPCGGAIARLVARRARTLGALPVQPLSRPPGAPVR